MTEWKLFPKNSDLPLKISTKQSDSNENHLTPETLLCFLSSSGCNYPIHFLFLSFCVFLSWNPFACKAFGGIWVQTALCLENINISGDWWGKKKILEIGKEHEEVMKRKLDWEKECREKRRQQNKPKCGCFFLPEKWFGRRCCGGVMFVTCPPAHSDPLSFWWTYRIWGHHRSSIHWETICSALIYRCLSSLVQLDI